MTSSWSSYAETFRGHDSDDRKGVPPALLHCRRQWRDRPPPPPWPTMRSFVRRPVHVLSGKGRKNVLPMTATVAADDLGFVKKHPFFHAPLRIEGYPVRRRNRERASSGRCHEPDLTRSRD